jgi:hypothetical protein
MFVGQELSKSQLALYRAVDEVLHYVWDPVGVSEFPEARDEYHAYLPQVFQMLQKRSTAVEIAQYLSMVSAGHMGLKANLDHDLKVAQLMLTWQKSVASNPP